MGLSFKKSFNIANYPELLRILAYAFDQMDTMAGVIAKDGTILFANRSALRAVGRTIDQVRGQHFRESPWRNHTPEAMALTDEMIEKACNGATQILEDTIMGADGNIVPAIFSISPIRDDNGEIIALAPEGKIISDIKMLQAKLEKERWEIQKWIDSMGSFIAKCTPEGKIITCNKPFLSSMQLHLEAIKGKYVCDLIQMRRFKNNQAKLQKVLFDARDGISGSVEISFSIDRDNQRSYLFSANPVRNSDGKIAFVALEIVDITEQVRLRELTLEREKEYSKRLENQVTEIRKTLEKTEQFYKNLIDANPTGVVFLDHESRVIYVNPKMEYYFGKVGIPKESIKGKLLSELNMHFADQFWHKDLTIKEDEVLFGQRRMVLSGNGNDMYCFEVLSGPIRILDTEKIGRVLTVTDVTDRVKLESELLASRIQAEKMSSLGLLVSGVAHELNNPLTSILGCADYLMEDQSLNDENQKAVEIIVENARRASRIVKNLLDVVYPREPKEANVNLNEIIYHTVELHQEQLHKKGIRVILDLCEGINTIVGDTSQLQQVIANFLQNAAYAIEESGQGDKIVFRTQNQDNCVIMEVSDNGPGIPKENRSKLFDPFFTTKPPGKGTGLGLSINYSVIQRHGGIVFLDTNSSNETRFIAKFPLADKHRVVRGKKVPDDMKWLPSKVLIIDDEKTLCRTLSKYFIELECQVDISFDGLHAKEKIKGKTYDLILLDLNMPSMDGVEFFQYLSTERPELAKKVVFMSGFSALEIEASAKFPFIPLLRKPFSLKDLISFLSEIKERPQPQEEQKGNEAKSISD